MNGWISVALIVAAELAAAIILLRLAVRRWWDGIVIGVLTALLIRPAVRHVTGDISRYTPGAIWSGDSDGKDQIIWASVASTVLLPLISVALCVFLIQVVWRAVRTADAKTR